MTTIAFTLGTPASVTLKIYNVVGQEVATLINNQQLEEGEQTVEFNASPFASGAYFYRIIAEGRDENGVLRTFTSARKMMLIK
jgi:hypothetical protein